MALAPYTVTALAESDDQGTDGKNIIVGAVVSAAALAGGATATLYDDAAGTNPSTTKTTGSNGQVTFYIEEGQYVLTVNGVDSEISLLEADDAKVTLELADTQLTPTTGFDLYHTGNTSSAKFGVDGVSQVGEVISIGSNLNNAIIGISRTSVSTSQGMMQFFNSTGQVGGILTDGSATIYGTSSDPRSKTFLPEPTDDEIDDYFNRVYDSTAVFAWKSDPSESVTWGFNAHKAIDNGLHMGFEGQGPRGMGIGDVYETIDATYDKDGNELTPKIEKKVTGAVIDQAKDVAVLVYKIEQQDRELKAIKQHLGLI